MNAPILLFTYKRLERLKQTVESLKANYLAEESDLYIFSDAAKKEEDLEVVNQVRLYISSITGFKNIKIINARENKGLAKSIITGVSQVIEYSNKVIVLEDDLSTTPNFLTFMNNALRRYELNKDVFSISGYSFNLGVKKNDELDSYFLTRGWSWGWATWKDRWEKVDWDVSDYSKFKVDLKSRKKFAFGGSDLNGMLDSQMRGELDSWAIRWFYAQYKLNGLTLYPVYSKVFNEGFDQDATHTSGSKKRYIPMLDLESRSELRFPSTIVYDSYYQKRFQSKMGIKERMISKLRSILKNLVR